MSKYSGVNLLLHVIFLRPLDGLSLWAPLLLWVIRIFTLSILLRTYIGPTVVRLVSRRVRIRSISLRSIRGVYVKTGGGIWRIDRIGISFHGPSAGTASRFSVKVQGLSIEIADNSKPRGPPQPQSRKVSPPTPSRFARLLGGLLLAVLSAVYRALEPTCRPAVRTFFVTTLRLCIRALPIVTNGLDFELDSASVSHAAVPGIRFSVNYAKLHSSVCLADLPSVVSVDSSKGPAGHKRFPSVADWNHRLRSGFRRSWDRAWGATQVTATVKLQVNSVAGYVDKTSDLFAGTHRGHYFVEVPSIQFSVSGRLNPHQGVEPHSVETFVEIAKVNIQIDVLQKLMKKLKERRSAHNVIRALRMSQSPLNGSMVPNGTHSNGNGSPLPTSAASQASSAWRSPLSPSSPFMGALSASMRWRWAARQSTDMKRTIGRPIKPVAYISYIKSVEVKLNRFTAGFQPNPHPGAQAVVLYATIRDIDLNVGLSHPDKCDAHKRWLGNGTGTSISEAYSVVLSASRSTIDRNGIGELMDHLRIVTLNTFRWDSLLVQWPSPWMGTPRFLSGDPNAQLLVSNISLASVELSERLDMLEKLAPKETSVEKTVHGHNFLPAMLSPVPRVSLGLHVGSVALRLISPTSQDDQEPFVLEARTDNIAGSMESHFISRPDDRFGNVERDYLGLDMDFQYNFTLNRTSVKVWFGPDAHLQGAHPQGFHAASYPNEPVFQLDSVHVGGAGSGLGEFIDEAGGIVSVDVSSIYTQFQCATEDISVELWQPDVIKALSCILRRAGGKPKPKAPKPSRRLLDQIPFGVAGAVSVGRFTLFMTSPDLAPKDTMGISRGLSCRMGISLSYSALRPAHCCRMGAVVARGHQRSQLLLPAEQVLDAILEPDSASTSEQVRALIQLSLWNIVLRDAFATPFAADDPYGLDDSSSQHRSLEFLHIRNVDVNATVSGERPNEVPLPNTLDNLHAEVTISEIKAKMHLSQIYNALLAVHTLQALLPPRPPDPPSSRTLARPPPTIRVHLDCHVDRLQLLWVFPQSSKLYTRVSFLSCQIATDRKVTVKWDHILVATAMPIVRDLKKTEEWEEFIRLPRWCVELNPDVKPLEVKIAGDSGRLRIPFDFVLADLIQDINLTIKSTKHLLRMVAAGKFHDPPSPPAEDVKRIPNITIQLGRLVVEAADEPLEARLGLIWRTGFDAARVRHEREEAFQAKVNTITLPKPTSASRNAESDFQFTPKHTVSISDARNRLDQVHSVSWKAAVHQARSRQATHEQLHAQSPVGDLRVPEVDEADLVSVEDVPSIPPLVRLVFNKLSLAITPPSFSYEATPDFLHEPGNDLPRDTLFSLLIPLHIHFTVSSLRLAFREYPLPLLHIPPPSKGSSPALDFDSDIVIAEEMGSDRSVDWVDCEIVKEHSGIRGAAQLVVRIPKTLMPVKSYARPVVRVMTNRITDFSWGVSYSAATQDLMRVIDTLSHSPRDSSPAVGFWDKMRLVLHWRVKVLFRDEVHLHMKGSRDPYDIRGHGAGFALCWRGSPQLLVGQPNDAGELIQVISDSMLVIIPNIEDTYGSEPQRAQVKGATPRRAKTVCAKLRSGVCFGVGFVLERSCGPECTRCSGKPFDRSCRLFSFKPHHDVRLELKDHPPELKSAEDSYNGFRSDFIHMSISLTSGLRKTSRISPSNLHLSPEVFAHFWSWWHLFNSALGLPIRQGDLYPRMRPISPKFGQHLATLKYLISVPQLFISHVYVDNSQDAWQDGVTPYVGVKALIEHFQADMHQRDTESYEKTEGGTKTVHHKPFYNIEVVLKGLDLRAMLAVFSDPLKQATPSDTSPLANSNYRTRNELESIDLSSSWVDMDDFAVDEDEISSDPDIHLLPTVSCPRFTYFKRMDEDVSNLDQPSSRSKFGSEDTHVCFIGKQPSVSQVQIELASARVEHLRRKVEADADRHHGRASFESQSRTSQESHQRRTTNDLPRMIALLEGYISNLHRLDMASQQSSARNRTSSYYMPSDLVTPEEWTGFDNVYQVHSPHIIMDNAIRDIMMQYYYCSRSRRGFEYHMAQRAVKFIRDQAQAAVKEFHEQEAEKHKGPAQAAAVAMKKLLGGDGNSTTPSVDFIPQTVSKLPAAVDPLHGWAEGISANKGHFCLLLKPQIVLRSTEDNDAVCVLAAVQGKLKTFSVMDDVNVNDPVSGKVMNRNFAWLTGLQTFSPSVTNTSGKDYVPLEVLIDLRADNSDFDRLVPQTDATFQYDKFNRLRLRNDVASVAKTSQHHHEHLQNQTDLIRLHVPRFTVSANDRHFQAISNIVTNLVLFTDAAHKTRAEKLEGLLFSYDFTNLASAADVVAGMQQRLRQALETKRDAEQKLRGYGNPGRVELLKIDAHILLLVEELNLIFDAIKLAQDKANTESDQKSALLLHASSEEVSWRMLDQHDQLLAKLAVRVTDFYWLSRHDSSTVNNLAVGDLQVFDGAADAEWTEILSKHDEPFTHPLAKRKLFLLAHWVVLPPVGGITIYEDFELTFHPMRLQIDIRVGRKIMEYLWPARRNRQDGPAESEPFVVPDSIAASHSSSKARQENQLPTLMYTDSPRHASFDQPSPTRKSLDTTRLTAHQTPPPLRKLGTSRSFSDLRSPQRSGSLMSPGFGSGRQDSLQVPRIHRTNSSSSLRAKSTDALLGLSRPTLSSGADSARKEAKEKARAAMGGEQDDAAEMKTRASQKTFVRVKVASLHLLLSIAKEDSFLCRDARIRTRDLEYRNQTWSFEELVDQFIPSGRNWRGWVKVAFQQPLVPVLPVARELITKTKWIASKKDSTHDRPNRPHTPRLLKAGTSKALDAAGRKSRELLESQRPSTSAPPVPMLPDAPAFLTSEPESIRPDATVGPKRGRGMRTRAISLFKRSKSHGAKDSRESIESNQSMDSTPTGSSSASLAYTESSGSRRSG